MATGAIIAKAKSMRANRLNKEDYDELLHKKSVAEIAGYLKNETQYAYALRDVRENNIHRGQLENILKQKIFRDIATLYHYADLAKKPYYQLHVQQIELELILQQLRVLISQEFADAIAKLPLFMRDYTTFELLRLGNVRSYDELLDVLARTKYAEVLAPFHPGKSKESSIDYTACERTLQRWYCEHVFEVIDQTMKGQEKKDLREFHALDFELSNMTKIYRFKRYFNAREDVIREALLPVYDHISQAKVEQMLAQPDAAAFLRLLKESWYHLDITDAEHIYIEWYMDRFRYQKAHKHMYYTTSAPLIFSSYLYLQRIELENIISIIEGVRYQAESEDIAAMLIY